MNGGDISTQTKTSASKWQNSILKIGPMPFSVEGLDCFCDPIPIHKKKVDLGNQFSGNDTDPNITLKTMVQGIR